MKLGDLYKFIIETGVKKDPRGSAVIQKFLKKEKEKYNKLEQPEKNEFDTDKLTNPYSDSRILYGKIDQKVKSILVGVDLETSELLLLETLRNKGKKIDLALAHHPEGKAYASFYEVMNMQADVLHKFGVPINIAESIMDPRIKEVSRKVLPQNHNRASDAARLLDIPFMTAHTPADNCVTDYLQKLFDKNNPDTIGDVVKILKNIPEYKNAVNGNFGPSVFVGSSDKRAGKIFVDMTGGTEGSIEAFENLAKAGIGTIVGMHMSDDHYKNAEKNHVNVVIAGHISSDTLGLNLLFDEVEKKFGKLEITGCSGFTRIKR
ncbi:MAG: NGG1p interacting factor NIF3 [Elusimicrobia bacterium RIFOXYA2_FULL_39_19]|nr:MAG: NGG1p interacting factor NIF3 [Elusimicrobia bacterium RIFOXYA2_FULL_39_19]